MNMSGKFLVGISVLVEFEKRILLLHRAQSKDHGPGEWEPVSGRVEQGESAEQAAIREVREETGLETEVVVPFHTFSFRRGPAGEELIGITFHAKAKSGEVTLSDEHDYFRWIPKAELLNSPVAPPIRECFRRFGSMRGDK